MCWALTKTLTMSLMTMNTLGEFLGDYLYMLPTTTGILMGVTGTFRMMDARCLDLHLSLLSRLPRANKVPVELVRSALEAKSEK